MESEEWDSERERHDSTKQASSNTRYKESMSSRKKCVGLEARYRYSSSTVLLEGEEDWRHKDKQRDGVAQTWGRATGYLPPSLPYNLLWPCRGVRGAMESLGFAPKIHWMSLGTPC